MLEAWAAEAFILSDSIQDLRSALPENSEPLPADHRAELVDILRRVHLLTGGSEMRTIMDMSGAPAYELGIEATFWQATAQGNIARK